MKIKIEAIIEVDDMSFLGCPYNEADNDVKEWFEEMLNDKENTMLILWSNDIGDEIGHTKKFIRTIHNVSKNESN